MVLEQIAVESGRLDQPSKSDMTLALARLGPRHLERPRARWRDAITTLADFVIATWSVDAGLLARVLPAGFAPDVRELDDGRRVALVSAVPFRDVDFRFAGMPWLRFSMGQTNYRAYVIRDGVRCVWFFGTSLTRPWVAIPRWWWRLPWHGARMKFDVTWNGEHCEHYSLRSESEWAPAELVLHGTDRPMGRLDGFADEEETVAILTHPLDGYYERRDGKLGSYSIWHDRLALYHGRVQHIRFPLFERLGLITRETPPHSVLVQRRTEFLIQLPPRVVVTG